MKRWAFVAVLAMYGLSTAHADSALEIKGGGFSIQIDERAQANLIYQLDCMARTVSCTSDVFDQLWRGSLGFAGDDQTFLSDWAAARGEIQKKASSGERKLPVKSSVPIFDGRAQSDWDKIRAVEFASSNIDELRQAWAQFISAESIGKLAAVIEHFRPRFDPWWASNESSAVQFMPGVEAAMRKAHAGELLASAARLYGSELGDRRLSLHLFIQPRSKPGPSKAELVGSQLVVEMYSGEEAERRVPVIVHELAHHLFARMPAEKQALLADTLIETGPAGMAAWNLFNEVQATVIGNMLAQRNLSTPERFQKYLDTPQSFYADEAIDLGARATEQVFVAAFKKGGAMKASFPREFVDAMRAKMGDMLETPSQQLRSVVVNTADDTAPWAGKLHQMLRPWSMWSMSPLGGSEVIARLNKYPGLSVVVVATPEQVPQLGAAAEVLGVTQDGVMSALGSSRAIMLVTKRTSLAYAFVLVGRDARALNGLIAALPYCTLKPGVCVRLE